MNGMKLYPLVEDMLDWTTKRQQALSSNITNIDTPGYRAKDIAFSEHLRSLQLETTDKGHLQSAASNPALRVYEAGGDVKPNGNSVSLDREMTELSKNGLQYFTLVQYLNHKLRTLRSAINDGGKV